MVYTCKGICITKYQPQKNRQGKLPQRIGQIFHKFDVCRICEHCYHKEQNISRCLCCGSKLQKKPKATKAKQRLRARLNPVYY